ncbi:hypothetical protein SERLA73DRAFT_169950 [Serpula lacrymans var. lacrymans S7.3]|uniref:NADP-dependent oxidoreductase domain-containing protein n=2 Tax=Serpula lacrymans var. lacrymans TaxID=341189 RepID=F8Q3D3_SERL3|nr:amp-CoA ligase [Serpula lacrymans var. lacrymans S7.9]EGN97694.1 hypothetical protein SERLA73DRAFT_169950 [Serpula lacrymans var. lacrymans S7.3]EGO23286.1 amp-CoA ligase [Serpula lacrymans var. lacrymans S7.9]
MSSGIPTRKIGDASLPAIGYGAMGIAGLYYGAADTDEERFAVLDRLFELGCTHWDTAWIYNDSEELIGNWFKRTGKRSQIFLATKFGITPTFAVDGHPEYAKQSCAESLSRLGVSCIDLFYLHRVDTTVPIEHTIRAMAELVKEGKVKYLGLSEPSAATLRRAHAVHPIAAIQVEYSPLIFDIEKNGLLETARELGVAVVTYSPLARGILAGRYKSYADVPEDNFIRTIPKYSEANFPSILNLVKVLESIAAKYDEGTTVGQVALAWLLAQGDDIIPIPGTKTVNYAVENMGALRLSLDLIDLQRIRQAMLSTEKDAHGNRYNEYLMSLEYQDTPIYDTA